MTVDMSVSTRSAPLSHRRRRLEAPELAFGLLLLLGAEIVLARTRGLSFYADDWDFVLDRRGMSPSMLLRPHGPHLSLVPIPHLQGAAAHLRRGLEPALPATFGFDLLLLAGLLGVVVARARWGRWWSLAPVLLLVTLGQGGASNCRGRRGGGDGPRSRHPHDGSMAAAAPPGWQLNREHLPRATAAVVLRRNSWVAREGHIILVAMGWRAPPSGGGSGYGASGSGLVRASH